MTAAVLQTALADDPVHPGKVRDIFDLGNQLLLVSTDRISAFDWVLPTGIPGKGGGLTHLSVFRFGKFDTPIHFLSMDLPVSESQREILNARGMLVRKANVVPIERVIDGYLDGLVGRSIW
ncbi:MAG: phosphoribosylaminoimidazolesuccinocarboxamide synthase [Planctomycetota bacterium]|nr:phosphoribosylaminoimidazolesuccinocarboxamide synthase [Planctomycetota bacterium]